MYRRRFINKVKKYQTGSEWDSETGMIYLDPNMPVHQQIVTDKSTKEDKKIANKNRKNLIATAPSVEAADEAGLFNSEAEKQEEKTNRIKNRQFAQSFINKYDPNPTSLMDRITGGLNFWDWLDVGLSTAGLTPGYGAAADLLNVGQNLLQSAGNVVVGDWDEAWYDLKSAGTSALAFVPATQAFTTGLKTKQVSGKVNKVKSVIDKNKKYTNVVDDVPTGGGMNITRGNKVEFETGPVIKKTDTRITPKIETKTIVPNPPKITYTPITDIIKHPNLYGRGLSNTNLNFIYNKPSLFTRGKRTYGKLGKFYNETLGMGSPLVQWRGYDMPGLTNIWGKQAFWKNNIQRQITPTDVVGYTGTTLGLNLLQKRQDEKIAAEQQILDDINSQSEAWKADSTAHVNQNIQNVTGGWDPNVSAGANLFQIGLRDAATMAYILQDMGYDPSVKRSLEEVENLMIKAYPDTLPNIDAAINLFEPDQKQMGGSYMGVPQQDPIGDEGYMGQMQQYQTGGTPSKIPGDQSLLKEMRKLNLELEEGIDPSKTDSIEAVRYIQEMWPKFKKSGFSSWDVIRYLKKNRPDLVEYSPNGAVKNIKGMEGLPKKKQVGGVYNQMKNFKMGGQNLPGGNVSPIPGSDAVEFTGQTHDEGGIMLDPKTEVEDGETMDKVNMKGKGAKDYFFSSYLKRGGLSFADHHKNILARGGDQGEIDMLAKMQEKAAGRNPNAVQTASHGGYKQYSNGGEQDVYGPNHAGYERALIASGYTGYGTDGTVSGADVGETGYKSIQGKNKQMVDGTLTHTGYYGEIGPAEREDFFNRNKEIMEKIGVTNWEDFDPATMTDDFQREFNNYLANEYNTNEDFRTNLANEGITNLEGLITTAGFHDKGHKSKRLDGFYGSYTHGKTSFYDQEDTPDNDPDTCKCTNTTTQAEVEYPCGAELPEECKEGSGGTPDSGCPCGTDPETYSEECCKGDSSTNIDRTLVGAAQLLPAAYAFAEGPDYMTEHRMASPGAIIPERLSKTHLERVDMNADRARNQADYQSMNKFVETAGLGSSSIAAKMAAYGRKQEGNRMITDAENKANIEIGNQELLADQTRKTTNVQNALDASKFNVTSQLEANKQNAIMEGTVDEFNRAADAAVKDRRLMAIDNATKTLAGMYTDKLKIQSQERMADAISGQTGIAERNRYSMQLLNSGNYTGVNDPRYIEAMDAYNRMNNMGGNVPTQNRYGGYRRRYNK
tara:strand:- start:904 stop:4587 length:3684 start_codon:yes stop_codon:yes gene_type:complete